MSTRPLPLRSTERLTDLAPDRPRLGAAEHPNIDRPGASPHPSSRRSAASAPSARSERR